MTNDTVFLRFPRPAPTAALGEDATPFFGGNQEWFARYTARLSGCGPVAAANALACLAAADPRLAALIDLHPDRDGRVGLEAYQAFMERVYELVRTRQVRRLCDVVDDRHARAAALMASGEEAERQRGRALLRGPLAHLPATFGNSAASLRRGVDRFAAQQEFKLLWREKKVRKLAHDEGLAFMEEALAAGSPLILLNHLNRVDVYYHGHDFVKNPKRGENPTMHFMTIADLRENEDGPELVLSDAGCIATVSYRQLHASWQGAGALGGSLLWFTVAPPVFAPLPAPTGETVGAADFLRAEALGDRAENSPGGE